MQVIGLAVVLAVSLILAPLVGEAQQQPWKVPRVGVLSPFSSSPASGILPHGRTRYPTVRRQLASKTSIFGPIAVWHRGCLFRERPTDF